MFSKETVQYEYHFPVTNEGVEPLMEIIIYIIVNVVFTINDINIIIIVDVIIIVIIIITVVVTFAAVVL